MCTTDRSLPELSMRAGATVPDRKGRSARPARRSVALRDRENAPRQASCSKAYTSLQVAARSQANFALS